MRMNEMSERLYQITYQFKLDAEVVVLDESKAAEPYYADIKDIRVDDGKIVFVINEDAQ